MCCIFTCCGWMIDLVQRLWTFTMSCCISSAVCCAFATASMSGIALGYNYSLAEYIDLKETNVSVYIKRGVFDDEFADDVDWRRSGHMPVGGHIGENNLRTGAPEDADSSSLRSGRRLDDSIFESDDQNKFEGSLMRLTAKAPYSSLTTKGVTSDLEMSEIMSKYPLGSIDQLKAIQSLINMRKSADARETSVKGMTHKSTYGFDERYLPHFPAFPDSAGSGRRIMPYNVKYNMGTPDNSLRKAVPGADINEPAKWLFPKLPPGSINKMLYEDYDKKITYPPPITPRPGPLKPTNLKPISNRMKPTLTKKIKESTEMPIDMTIARPNIDRDLEEFKERLLLDKFEAQGIKTDELGRIPKVQPIKSDVEDYDEDVKGLPVRRKREINFKKKNKPKLFSVLSSTDKNINLLKSSEKSDRTDDNIPNTFKGAILLNRLFDTVNKLGSDKKKIVSPLVQFETFMDIVNGDIKNEFTILAKLSTIG